MDVFDRRVVLVIDEVEALHGASSSSLLDALISNGGASLRTVVVGRAIDDLELDELRWSGGLVEVTAADLRLTLPETIELARGISGTDAADELLATVHGQTDGWVHRRSPGRAGPAGRRHR